jgi:hypothetical protein
MLNEVLTLTVDPRMKELIEGVGGPVMPIVRYLRIMYMYIYIYSLEIRQTIITVYITLMHTHNTAHNCPVSTTTLSRSHR